MSDQRTKIINILRSIIISSPQKGKSLHELERDFREFEGTRIPLFGYRSLEEFLRASGEFILELNRGQLIVYERPNEESWHISKLIADQHKSKKRAPVASRFQNNFRRFVRQPFPQSAHPISNTRSPNKSFTPRTYNNVSNTQRSVPPVPQRSQLQTQEYSFDQLSHPKENNSGQSRDAKDATDRFSSSGNSQMNPSSRPITHQHNQTMDSQMNQSSRPITQQNQTMDLRNRINEIRNIPATAQVDRTPKDNSTIPRNNSEMHQASRPILSQNQASRPSSQQIQSSRPILQQNESTDLRNRINDIRKAPPMAYVDLTGSDDSNISRNNTTKNQINKEFMKQSPPISPKSPEIVMSLQQQKDTKQITPTASTNVSTYAQQTPPILLSNLFFDTRLPPPNVQPSKMQDRLKNPPMYTRKSVNDRLIEARQNHPIYDLTKEPDLSRNVREYSVVQQRESFQSKTVPSSSEKCLLDYCNEHHLSIPTFKLFEKNNRYQCFVTIDNCRYSTYPTYFGNVNEARMETAKHALERLVSLKSQQKYEVCLDNEADLATKIFDCIKDCPSGVFLKKIPEKFTSSYEELLPPDWMKSLAKYPKCFTIEDCLDDQIVYIAETSDFDQKMDNLVYPWNEEYWCLFIKQTTSTAEIWGSLIGKEYSSALDSLVTDIELELLKNKEVAKVFNIGQIYLVLISECAYRVRVEKIDHARNECLCFFIDEGDQRWFNMSELYVCQSKFIKFPPQAIRFAMYGLEEFAEYDFARKHLEETLIGKPLIGQICTKKDDFISQQESDDLEHIIHVVLYDTSTEDDINLHPVIVEKICADIPTPELIYKKLTRVYVSHIDDNGSVFVQLQTNGVPNIHNVNKLIHKLTQQDGYNRLSTVPDSSNSNKNLFLVIDEDTKKWCRGKLISEGTAGCTMFLIDYGKTKVIPRSKIYAPHSLSQALLTFPPQAMQIKLSGFDEFPANLVSTLRGHFSGDANAYVMKEQVSGTIPEVNLFFIKDEDLVCVNESLKEQDQGNGTMSSFSRQCSVSSNTSRDSRADSMTTNVAQRNLPKFQPPGEGDYFEVEVLMVSNPSNFVIRPIKYMPQWSQHMKNLQEYCKSSRDIMQLSMLEEGQPYACLHNDGLWYRVIVTYLRHPKIYVSFCDIGEIDNIDDVKKFKILPENYRVIPKLAITAKLFDIKPIKGDWEMDDIFQFKEIVSGKKFQALVGKTIEQGKFDNPILEVRLIDVSKEYDECINDSFIKNDRAIHQINSQFA